EPEGPSIEKNSPSRTASDTRSTASTLPYARLTPSNSTAGGLGCNFPPAGASAALGRDVVLRPAAVGNALAGAALAVGRAPEVDLVEIVEAVGLAAFLAEQRIALARIGIRRQRAEPGSDVALHFR